MKTRARPRLKDDTLVVGIDVAKRKHVAVAELDGRFSKPFRFNNDREGFQALVSWLEQRSAEFGTTLVVVGLEATGIYGRSLEQWLISRGLAVYRVPSLLTHRAKEMLDRSPTKSDPKDACVIADLVRQGKGDLYELPAEAFERLRALGALRHRLGVTRGAALNRLHRVIDQAFPELPGYFKSIGMPTCRALLRAAPTPAAVLALGLENLTAVVKKASRGMVSAARARAIYEAAERSIGFDRALDALVLEVELTLDELDAIEARIARVEAEQVAALNGVPYAERLAAIPGLPRTAVASLLGETGDLRRYRHSRQLLKMAGLNLVERSSGEHKGKMSISRRGRARFRRAIYLAALGMSAPTGILAESHEKLTERRPGIVSVVAGMRKLLRAIFAMVRDGTDFAPERLKALPAPQAA